MDDVRLQVRREEQYGEDFVRLRMTHGGRICQVLVSTDDRLADGLVTLGLMLGLTALEDELGVRA